ncbi:MAG: hypothetical protein SF051_13825 [Elusimicrobiota bacterium]|nr:hypothetical protein [Elusimicrobiota bacterium]
MAKPLSPLVAAVAVFLAAPCAAADPRIDALRAELARAFLDQPAPPAPARPLPDIETRATALLNQGAPGAELSALTAAAREARAVQRGRESGMVAAVYEQMVLEAARGLGVEPPESAVPVYLGRGVARNLTTEDRHAVQSLLVKLENSRLTPDLAAAVSARLTLTRRQLGTLTETDWAGGGDASPRPAPAPAPRVEGGHGNLFVVAYAADAPRTLTPAAMTAARLPAAQPHALRPAAATPEGAPLAMAGGSPSGFTTQPIPWFLAQGSLDGARIRDLIDAAQRLPVRSFGGWCLRWVKRAVQNAGLMEPPPRNAERDAARERARQDFMGMRRAFLMGRLTETQLEELGLQPIVPATIPWTADSEMFKGLFLVWAPTCNGEEINRPRGANAVAGHVEYIIPHTSPLAARIPRTHLPAKSDGTRATAPGVLQAYSTPDRTVTWTDTSLRQGGRVVYAGLGRITQSCLTVLAPLDLD